MRGGFSKEAKTTLSQPQSLLLRLIVASWDNFENKEAVIQNLPIFFQVHDVGKIILSYLSPAQFFKSTGLCRGLTVYRNNALSAPYPVNLCNPNLLFWCFLPVFNESIARTKINLEKKVKKILISQKYLQIITLDSEGIIKCWCLNTGVPLLSFDCNEKNTARMIALTSNEEYCVVREPSVTKFFSMRDKELDRKCNKCSFGAFMPAGLIVLDDNREIFFSNDSSIEISSGKEYRSYLKQHTGSIFDVKSISKNLAVSCSGDKLIKVWSLRRFFCLYTLSGHTHNVYSLALTHNKKILISGSEDATVRIWDLQKRICVNTISFEKISRVRYVAVLEQRSNEEYLMVAITEKSIFHDCTKSTAQTWFWNPSNNQIQFANSYSFKQKVTAFDVSAGFIALGFERGGVKLAACNNTLFFQQSFGEEQQFVSKPDSVSNVSVNCNK